jgi:hypothetical protein
MTQDTCVVIKHLDEDIPPEPAQPLTIPEHADSTARSLVNRLERPHLHTCNGSDRIRRGPSGNTAPPAAATDCRKDAKENEPATCVVVACTSEYAAIRTGRSLIQRLSSKGTSVPGTLARPGRTLDC